MCPVRAGDTLRVESEVLEIRPSRSRPNRGTVTLRSETKNQHGETTQILTARLIAFRRDTPMAAAISEND